MRPEQIINRRRIIELSYEANTTHIGSALSVVDIIETVYAVKRPGEKFVLSNGHAAAALYAVMERYGLLDNPSINKLGAHPDRNAETGIEVSSGSLGQGFPIAVGMALADREKNVYCCVSDGECAEGSIWEAMRIAANQRLTNLKLIVNANGYSGYGEVDTEKLAMSMQSFGWNLVEVDGHGLEGLMAALKLRTVKPVVIFAHTRVDELPFLSGFSAHYYKMTAADYQLAIERWSKS